jgi:hypothetical protein
VLALRPGLWSHGDVRLTPGVKCAGWVFMKDLWIGFVEGSNREPREPLRLEENLERSCVDLGQRVGGLHILPTIGIVRVGLESQQ